MVLALCSSYITLDGIQLDFKTLRIYISAHVVSTSFKILNVLLTSLDMEREAVSKTKIKGRREKFEFLAGRP